MKTAIFAAAIAVSVSAPALAQESAPFTGPHIEVITGYDAVDTGVIGTPDGIIYGLAGGYDIQAGGAVLGLEVEAADSTAHRLGLTTDRDLYVGGRVGFTISDRALAYAKVGYTNARVEAGGLGANADGIRGGAGLEYKLGGKLFVKGEYRYSNYEAGVQRHQFVTGLGVRF